MHPGEVASAHAHSASALRFIMEGEGAYTIVDGHKISLQANDLVLTPNGTWHEHGVEASGTPCVWQDGLDIPLVNALEANFYAVHPNASQTVGYALDDSSKTWSAPGLRPANTGWSKGYSPLLKYEWKPTYEALLHYGETTEGSPHDGIMMNYVNPMAMNSWAVTEAAPEIRYVGLCHSVQETSAHLARCLNEPIESIDCAFDKPARNKIVPATADDSKPKALSLEFSLMSNCLQALNRSA